MPIEERTTPRRRLLRRYGAPLGLSLGLAMIVAGSAVVTKAALRRTNLEPLTAIAAEPATVEPVAADKPVVASVAFTQRDPLSPAPAAVPLNVSNAPAQDEPVSAKAAEPSYLDDPTIRWFNGRPVRPAKTITMVVTAYSPDERSCGPDARGITSSVHNVYTNAMKLVAADSRVLPLGSIISVPGYDEGNVVPVLDRGGAIKGNRLDVLYPTHEVALKWGVQKLPITVWEYADGLPPDDYRKVRDSKN